MMTRKSIACPAFPLCGLAQVSLVKKYSFMSVLFLFLCIFIPPYHCKHPRFFYLRVSVQCLNMTMFSPLYL
jgi:hypothetical protein